MQNCPECGEKVADIDIFCSYCGITLTRPAIEEDPSLSETIVGTPPGMTFDKPAQPEIQPPPSPFTAGDTSASWSVKTGQVEVPAEVLGAEPEIETALGPAPEAETVTPAEAPPPDSAPVERPFDLPIQPPAAPVFESPVAAPEPVPAAAETSAVPTESVPQPPLPEPPAAVAEFEPVPVSEAIPEPATEPEPALPEPEPFTAVTEPPEAVPEAPALETGPVAGRTEPEALPEPEPFTAVTEPPEAVPEAPAFETGPVAGRTEPEALPEPEPFTAVTEPPEAVPEAPAFETEPEPVVAETEPPAPEPAPELLAPVVEIQPEAVADGEAGQYAAAEPLETEPAVPEPSFPEPAPDFVPVAENIPLPSVLADMEREAPTAEPRFGQPADAEVAVPGAETPAEAPSVAEEVAVPAAVAVASFAGTEPEPEAASSPTPAEEPRPATAENVGVGDTDGRKAAKLKPLDEGTLLNKRYEIVRKIGGGGMGAVYLANDKNLGGIPRAVKEMVQSYIEAEQQEKAVADFQREAMILTGLEHPSIPTIFDYFFDDKEGRFYLVMKYISGGDLAGRLRSTPEGRLDEKTVTEWGIQVADVLDYLHRQDPLIVYRDLKPANIMIDGNTGRLMLIDFGIARSINKEEKGVTAVGTMGYAPPELFSGNVEPRSDIYSLGSTMFHLLTGADPQSNPLLIFDFQKNPRPRQINPQLSDQIEQILMRAVEYNADLRFSSAAEMRAALEDHLINLKAGKVSFGVRAVPSAIGFSEQHVFCGFCGKQIVASDVFCAFCGSQQPIAQQSFASLPAIAPRQAAAKLHVIVTGDLDGSGFTLEKDENLIGRRDPMSNIFPEVDLSKYDPQTKISRRHARIWRDGSNYLLEDLGSSNGTVLVSGTGESLRLLPRQPRPLANGDKFRVGDTLLQFTVG